MHFLPRPSTNKPQALPPTVEHCVTEFRIEGCGHAASNGLYRMTEGSVELLRACQLFVTEGDADTAQWTCEAQVKATANQPREGVCGAKNPSPAQWREAGNSSMANQCTACLTRRPLPHVPRLPVYTKVGDDTHVVRWFDDAGTWIIDQQVAAAPYKLSYKTTGMFPVSAHANASPVWQHFQLNEAQCGGAGLPRFTPAYRITNAGYAHTALLSDAESEAVDRLLESASPTPAVPGPTPGPVHMEAFVPAVGLRQLLRIPNAIVLLSLCWEVFQLSTFAIQQLTPAPTVATNATATALYVAAPPVSETTLSLLPMAADWQLAASTSLGNTTVVNPASSWGSDLNLIVSALYLDFTRLAPETIFAIQSWTAIGLVGLLLLLVGVQVCSELRAFGLLRRQGQTAAANKLFFHSMFGAIMYGHGVLHRVHPLVQTVTGLLADALLLLVCNKLLTIVTCTSAGVVQVLPSMQCWTGSHAVLASCALIAFSFYLPLSSMIAPMLTVKGLAADQEAARTAAAEVKKAKRVQHAKMTAEEKQAAAEAKQDAEAEPEAPVVKVQFVQPFLSLVAVGKCVMVVGSNFFGGGTQLALVIASAALCFGLLAATVWWSYVARPFSAGRPASHGFVPPSPVVVVTNVRMLGFAGGVAGAIVGAIAVGLALPITTQLIAVAVAVSLLAVGLAVLHRSGV